MPHSSTATNRRKPAKALDAKQNKSYPLYPNAPKNPNARWCKKVKGKLHYFGKCAADPKGEKALEEWKDQKESILLTGRKSEVKDNTGLTVEELCNQFMEFKEGLLDSGELAQRITMPSVPCVTQ